MADTTRSPVDRASDDRLVTPLFVLIVTSGVFYFLAIGAMLPTLPTYVEQELGGGGVEVGLAVGAFAVSAALVRPAAGRLGDTIGRRRMALAGGLIASVALTPIGLVDAVWWVVLARFVAGFGEAGFFIGAATAVQDLSPDHRRGEAASFFSIAIYTGLGFGPSIGELVYDNVGPSQTWLVIGGCLALAALLAHFIPDDLGRVASPPTRRGLIHPAAIPPGIVLLSGVLAYVGFASFLPLYIDEIGLDDAGPFFLLYGCIVLVIRVAGARVPDRLGPVRASTFALLAISAGLATVGLVQSPAGAWTGTILMSVGMALHFPALFSIAVNHAPDGERSHAVGSFSLFFDVGQGIGAPILGVAVVAFGTERAAFLVGAAAALAGVVAANTVLRRATPIT